MPRMHWTCALIQDYTAIEYENAPLALGFTDLVRNRHWGRGEAHISKEPALDEWLVVEPFRRQLKIGQKCVESRAKMRRQKQKQNWTNHSCMAMWYARHTGSDLGHFCEGQKFGNSATKLLEMIRRKGRGHFSGSWQFYNLILPPRWILAGL